FRTDIADILPEIDVFLITSKTEGLGTTVLDAIANKIPVVATAAGGIPEMIRDEETGLICDTGDYKILSKNVQRMISDKRLQNKVIENAYQLVNKEFTKEITANKTLEIYKAILSI
ncbi:MAG: glycosyltransferase family 4 protein, partial [Bacteroidia bacterium]|nr:glycosyltransferase family 4 protein [Bacteroidia bacterium]